MTETWQRARPDDARPEEWDAALRLSDRVANHLLANREGANFQWIAARLHDGGAQDDALFPTREDAIAHQLAPSYYAYVRIPPSGMSPRSAWRFLLMTRSIYGTGTRFDTEGMHVILPSRAELGAAISPRAFRSLLP